MAASPAASPAASAPPRRPRPAGPPGRSSWWTRSSAQRQSSSLRSKFVPAELGAQARRLPTGGRLWLCVRLRLWVGTYVVPICPRKGPSSSASTQRQPLLLLSSGRIRALQGSGRRRAPGPTWRRQPRRRLVCFLRAPSPQKQSEQLSPRPPPLPSFDFSCLLRIKRQGLKRFFRKNKKRFCSSCVHSQDKTKRLTR